MIINWDLYIALVNTWTTAHTIQVSIITKSKHSPISKKGKVRISVDGSRFFEVSCLPSLDSFFFNN